MLERVLDADAERREQERAGEALLVHDLQADVAVAVLGADRLELAERLDGCVCRRGLPRYQSYSAPGLGHRVERRVGDVRVDRAADEQPALAVDVGPAHAAVAQRAVGVAGEGVLGLVVVVGRHRPHGPAGRRRRRRRRAPAARSRPPRDLLLLADPAAWIGRRRGTGLRRQPAVRPDVTFDPAAGHAVPHDPTAVDLHGLLLAADALGCVRRMLDRTVAYAAERRAFGQPIGGFQAVQHRLVDHAVRARGMGLAVADAARLLGDGAPRRRPCGRPGRGERELGCRPRAARPAPAHRRRSASRGSTACTSTSAAPTRTRGSPPTPATALRTIADLEGWTRAVDVDALPPGGAGVRRRARAPDAPPRACGCPRDADEERADPARGSAALYEAGYLGGGWPEAWGGRPDHLPMHDLVLMEELILGDAYRPLDQVMLAAHTLLEFGTDAQKQDLLPRIRSGEHIWCQLFSEPDAGSDLAALRTRAEPRRRRLARDRPEGLEHRRAVGRHGDAARPHRPRRRSARRDHGVRDPDGPPRHRRAADPGDDRATPSSARSSSTRSGSARSTCSARSTAAGGSSRRAWPRSARSSAPTRSQLERLFADLVALAAAARLPDGTTAIAHEDVQARLAHARARVEEVTLIVRDTVERILRDDEHPSDGPVAKLAYTELDVSPVRAGPRPASARRSRSTTPASRWPTGGTTTSSGAGR